MILLPSRRRTERLKNFFKSAKDTGTTCPGFVIVDTKDFLDNSDSYLTLQIEHFLPNWKLLISRSESMGDKIREYWDSCKVSDWVGILNDDHYCVTPEWDKKLLAHLNGKNFVSCNDGDWKANGTQGKAAGATIWSGDLIRAVGWIFPPKLQHTFIDDIWEYLGRETGCWQVDMSVHIEHRHVNKGEGIADETHKKMENFFYTDGQVYLNWRKNEATRALKAIKELQDGIPVMRQI